jgi:hypothetical protein
VKLLRCPSPQCATLGASLPKSFAFPQGEPAIVGRYVSEVHCARCGRRSRLSPGEYASLPELQHADFEAIAKAYRAPAVATMHIADFVGYGLQPHEAADVHDAGFRQVAELEALER